MTRFRMLPAAAAIVLFACATGAPTPAVVPAAQVSEAPRTVAEMLAQEADLGGSALQPIAISDSIRSAAPLAGAASVTDGGQLFLEFPIAGSVPLNCYVWPEEQELGTTAVRLADVLFAHVGEVSEGPMEKQVAGIWGGAAGGAPYHGVQWVYRVGEALGTMKVAAANKSGLGIGCVHHGGGFSETFIGIVTTLVENLENDAAPPAPYFTEIVVTRAGGQPIGVQSIRFSLDEDGDTRVDEDSSTLAARSADAVLTSFTKGVSFARPDGSVINSQLSDSNAEGPVSNIGLVSEDGRWHVRGTYQGKDLDTELAHTGAIASSRSSYLTLGRKLIPHGSLTTKTDFVWVPTADPTGVLESVSSVDPSDTSKYSGTVGPIQVTGVRDASGQLVSGVIKMGRIEMSMERVFVQGEI